MSKTNDPGIDYGAGTGSNTDPDTGIRYGVIPFHDVMQSWCDSSEGDYGDPEECECPECGTSSGIATEWGDEIVCEKCGHEFSADLPDCCEPIGHSLSDSEYTAYQSNSGPDIFITKSPYYTHAQFCSPCAPGAGYLRNHCPDGPKTFCFGHDWFEGSVAPYPVYSVETGELVEPIPTSK